MAKRRTHRSPVSFIRHDLAGWNFVIFLVLSFILLVTVLSAMGQISLDLRSRAGLACSNPLSAFGGRLPKSSDCVGTWKLSNDTRGCQVFVCESPLKK